MHQSVPQLAALVTHALPGATLHTATPLGARTSLLHLGDGRRVVVRSSASPDPWAGDPVRAEVAALRVLQAEVDLPVASVLACATDTAGEPFALLAYLEGTPLSQVATQLTASDLYTIGRDLGSLLTRVHSYTTDHYGTLDQAHHWQRSTPPANPSVVGEDVAYLHQRLRRAWTQPPLDPQCQQLVAAWLAAPLPTSGQAAVLTHGDLQPDRILVRRRTEGWHLAGLVGWGFAQAWRPGWDHTILLAATADPGGAAPWPYFDLRTGYGIAYDAGTERRYDQVRDLALLPYRLIFYSEAGRTDLVASLLATTDH